MNKLKISLTLEIILLVFGFVFISSKPVFAADIAFTVDSLADTSDDTLDGVCDIGDGSCTLRAALEEAQDISSSSNPVIITFSNSIEGGTVSVNEALPGIPQYVSILGPGADKLTIDGSNAGIDLYEYGFAVMGNNIEISGLNIKNFTGQGVGFWGGSNINISNNTISNNNNCGISIGGNIANIIIANNDINNSKYQGVLFWTGNNTNVLVTGNNINNNVMDGVYMHDTSGNVITDNQIFNNQRYGIDLEGNSNNNTFSNNTIESNLINGIVLTDSTDNIIIDNNISSNIQNGINLINSNNNEISSNNVNENGAVDEGYWTASVSTMKYGLTTYDGLGIDLGGEPNLEPTIVYAGSDMSTSIISSINNILSSSIESDGAEAGGFDVILFHYPQNDELYPVMEFVPHGLIPNLAVAKLMIESLIPGATAEAMLQNVLTKSGDTWIYNGITNGVNGVIVETDGEEVTLATEVEPNITHHEGYGPYSGIIFNGTSSSNTLIDNIIEDNANGVSFLYESTNNTINDGSITSYNYNAVSRTTGTNTLNNVDFDRDQINVISGTLIILPEINEIPRSRTQSSGSSPSVIAQFQAEQQRRAINAGITNQSNIQPVAPLCFLTEEGKADLTSQTLRLGMKSYNVYVLQKYLNCYGYSVSQTGSGSLNNETTYFGPLTKQAVIKFQLANGLNPDGIVGSLTQAKIK